MSKSTTHYDNIVIGSGQGGTPLASALAKVGQRTALIESTHIGGTCINEGCTPTKTMVASARVAYLARRANDYGVSFPGDASGEVAVDMIKVRQRKRDIVESFRGGSERRLRNAENLDWITGTAKLLSDHEIEVTGSSPQTISGDRIFLNVGCQPVPLTIPGADTIQVLNSTTVMELDTVPEHLIVVGGGYVGCEFAQMFRRFGSKVTIIQHAKQLLGREDVDIAEAVRDVLLEDGLEVYFSASADSVSKTSQGIELQITTTSGPKTIQASHILAAAGRSPMTPNLGLDAAGVKTNKRGFIECNDYFQTSTSHIYALGDCVAENLQFTHVSYDDFRVLRDNLIPSPEDNKTTISDITGTGSGHPQTAPRPFNPPETTANGTSQDEHHYKRSRKDRLIPYTVFIDPQLGRIGPTLSQLESLPEYSPSSSSPNNNRIRVHKMPMAYVARALEIDESRGVIKVVVDTQTEKILSASVLGFEGGELMTMLQMAMMGGLSYKVLQDGVFSHPGLGESLNNLWAM